MVDKQKIIQYWQVEKKSEVDILSILIIQLNYDRLIYFTALAVINSILIKKKGYKLIFYCLGGKL